MCDESLIFPVSPEQINKIEGSGFDLRVDKVMKMRTRGDGDKEICVPFLGVRARRLPGVDTVEPSKLVTAGVEFTGWFLTPNAYYLVQTAETLRMPPDLVAFVDSRTTLFRGAAVIHCSPVHPGYTGLLTFGLQVFAPNGFFLEQGARIVTARFACITRGDTDIYQGVWSGDRATTDGQLERAH